MKLKFLSRPVSLKFRIIAAVLLMLISCVWLLTIAIARQLEQDMTELLESQQFSAVSYVASEIDSKLMQRINLVSQNSKLVAQYFDSPTRMREFLKGRIGLQALFQAGLMVIDKKGMGIADYPVADGREDGYFAELEYFQEAIATGKTVVGKPRIGKYTKKPGVAIAAPIKDQSGVTIGVLVGYATLSDTSLFGQVENGIVGKSGTLVIIDPRNLLIVSSSDPVDILKPLQHSGTSFANTIAGVEGSRLEMTHKGKLALVSTKLIPSTGWAVQMALPVVEAFAPIRSMQRYAYGVAVALSLFFVGLFWLFIRRALKPLEDVTSSIRKMVTQQGELQTIALFGSKEIQDLAASFNTLMIQRRQSEESVRQSEERLSRAELASKSGNWELHLDTKMIIASKGAAQIYGLDNNHYELAAVQKVPLAEYRPLLDSALRDLIEQNKPYDVTLKIRTADTEEVKDIHSIAIFDKEKRIVFGVIQDITDQSLIQQALKDEVQRRRIVFEQSRDGIALLRPDGSVAELNLAFAKMLGYSREELGLMNVRDWDIKFGQDELESIARTLGQGHLNIETRHLRKNGTAYDVEISISGVEWGGESYLFCLHRDITERNKAAMKLLESEARLKTIIDNEPESIKIVDAQGRLIQMNPAGLAMIEADSLDQVIGHEILEFVVPEDRNAFTEMHNKVIAGESMQQEFGVIGLKGGHRWLETHAVPMKDHGETVHLSITRDITERKQAEEALCRSEEDFRDFFETNASVMLVVDPATGMVIAANKAAIDYYGYPAERLIGMHIGEINAMSPESLAEEESRSLREDRDCYLLSQHLASGEVRDVEVYLTPIERGGHQLLFSIVHDITGRIQAEAQLRLAATVFTHAREGILITEPDGTIIDVNETFGLITGYNSDEVKGLNPRLLSSGQQDKDFYVELWGDLIHKGYWSGEILNRRKNGELYTEMLTISAVRDIHGTTRKYVALFSDITRMKEHENNLRHMAHYDVLTGLPNRVMLSDRLKQAMAQTIRRGQRLAVCYLDLDGFKMVNDAYGHEAGDQLLIAVSNSMKGSLREGDTLARIGGDEFVAVLLDLSNEEASFPMLKRLIAAAAEPVSIGGIITHVSASLGVTYYPQEEEVDADQLLRQADQAMYQAKLGGKNRYHVFCS